MEHRCCKGVKPGCNHDKGLVGNFTETFGSLEGFMLYLLPVASIRCSNARRRERQELIELYSDHSLALPYFGKMYGYSSVAESESPVRMNRKNPKSDEKNAWHGNIAVPHLIFDDKKKFEEKLGNFFKVDYEKLTECFIFLNSGGVTSKTKCIPMNNFFLKILNSVDKLLVKLFPSIFCMGRRIVLKKAN